MNLLNFNPDKRYTASQAIKHSFLQQFITSKDDQISSKVIKPDISDNTKLTVK